MIDVTVDPVGAFKALVGRYTKVQNKATILHDWNSEQAAADFKQALVDCAGNIQKASKLFFAAHLQGKSVKTKLGLVRINSDSRGKVHYGWRDLKSYAVPKIPEILINGDVGDFVARYKDRPDSKEGFFEFKQWIDCADFRILARLKVAQDAVGYMVYTLSTKKEALNRDPTISNELRGFEAGLDSSKGVSFDSIEPDSPDDVNIEILSIVDKATGKALSEAEAVARLGQNPTDSSDNSDYAKYLANPMLKSRMNKSLDQRYSIDGKVISGRQLLTDKVNDGWTIGKKEEIDHKKNEQLKKELHEFLTQGGFGHWRSERRHELDTLLAKGGGRFNEVVIKPILEDQNSGDQIDLNKFELAFVEHLMAVRSKISNQSSSTPNGTQFDSLSATDDTMDSAVAAYADQLKFFLARLGVSK